MRRGRAVGRSLEVEATANKSSSAIGTDNYSFDYIVQISPLFLPEREDACESRLERAGGERVQ